ncbi:hypothetical protein CLF_112516 [Clonorchis sinensis]|uniref:Uncharacterized protein n=1 Tax=Clonorchis sinensis TaxID=79923 RepID=G7YWI1_CLOSI|nr:hypothetical protein CLF_112516 [Clonorchis sinensis]
MSFEGDSANSFVMHGEKGPEDITRIDAKKDLGIWLSSSLSFSLHLEKSAQKAFAVLRMIRRTFSRITRTDFQILYGAYVRPLLEYANPVVYSGRTKDVILIERVQRAATKMVAGLKSMDYETRLVVLDLFPLEYRCLRGSLILTCALFGQGLANRPLLEYVNPFVYSGCTKDVILIERVQRAATKMVAGLKSMDYETRLVVLDLFPLEYRRLRGDLILTYALFEQGLANRFFTVDPANTRRGHACFPIHQRWLSDYNLPEKGVPLTLVPRPPPTAFDALRKQMNRVVDKLQGLEPRKATASFKQLTAHGQILLRQGSNSATSGLPSVVKDTAPQPGWRSRDTDLGFCMLCDRPTTTSGRWCATDRVSYHADCYDGEPCPLCGGALQAFHKDVPVGAVVSQTARRTIIKVGMDGQENQGADLNSADTRAYLDKTVVPILLQGLTMLVKERRQLEVTVRADREAWLVQMDKETEEAYKAGSTRRRSRVARATGPLKPL